MEAIFNQTIEALLKRASGAKAFYEKSIYADDVMESNLAPLIDKVMQDNPDVYVKSHPRGRENKPHMEIHLSITAKDAERPAEKLQKAVMQFAKAIGKIGGKVISDE
jgi:molybdopterin-biosynthesis enzyme MoeA-like protein